MKTVIEMAREAGAMQLMSPTKHENLGLMGNEVIGRFAALVREDEREACAKVCEQSGVDGFGTLYAAAAIRARGE